MIRHNVRTLRRWLENRFVAAIMRRTMGTITHVSTPDPVAALSFDGGPDPQWTPRLLDILEKHQVRATFFMIGKYAQTHPEIVYKVAQAGHAIGNHSWDHPSFPLTSRHERKRQILACAEAIGPYEQKLFRPPYGHQNLSSRFDAMLQHYQIIAWSLHAYDWEDRDADWMISRLKSHVRPGSIILLHDAICDQRHRGRESLLKTVDIFLEQVSGQFSFTTIPELLCRGQPQKSNWYMKPNVAWLNSYKRVI